MNIYPKYELVLTAFGLQTLRTAIYAANIASGRYGEDNTSYPAQDSVIGQAVARSRFDLPVFDNITLDILDNNLRIDTVLIEVSQSKTIIKTAIQGIDGTVKEFISDSDYQVSIKGLIASEDRNYPESDVTTLIDILKKKEAIRVTSAFLNYLKIDDLVVESYNLKMQEGFENIQLFEMQCVSDRPVELIISEDNV
jgi:hypothetical protein